MHYCESDSEKSTRHVNSNQAKNARSFLIKPVARTTITLELGASKTDFDEQDV